MTRTQILDEEHEQVNPSPKGSSCLGIPLLVSTVHVFPVQRPPFTYNNPAPVQEVVREASTHDRARAKVNET